MSEIKIGATNVIAIDELKKGNFSKIYKEALKEKKVVTEQPIAPEQPINFQNEPATNADILSQNLETNPIIEPEQKSEAIANYESTNETSVESPVNPEVNNIIIRIAEIQGKLDDLAREILKKMPDKAVQEEKKAIVESINNIEQTPLMNNQQESAQQEIAPFGPPFEPSSQRNIFDDPQGPAFVA